MDPGELSKEYTESCKEELTADSFKTKQKNEFLKRLEKVFVTTFWYSSSVTICSN